MEYARISSRIPKEDREKVESLVKKGMFSSMSDFYRTAIRRLLRDLESYRKERERRKREILKRPGERIEEDMREITKFADELF
jgi:Arc/MetJ-type ribon-helix-helix transcriptional regulator